MTRTERNITKRAILRDRSESKSGLDKSDRKGGAGAHNWGALNDEKDLELLAKEDNEDEELSVDEEDTSVLAEAGPPDQSLSHDGSLNERRASASAVGLNDQEWQEARQFRAKALKDGSDLGAIARTSAAVSTSPRRSSTVTITTDATTGVLP
ncbi:hypothetical protein BU17DRAFT_102756 [Hysterangium stoloniferum]|nr:hypothetical protein BU17DRAFT_102756 [Hysterangium stoloniferum]